MLNPVCTVPILSWNKKDGQSSKFGKEIEDKSLYFWIQRSIYRWRVGHISVVYRSTVGGISVSCRSNVSVEYRPSVFI